MATMISGTKTTEAMNSARKVVDMSDKILLLEGNKQELFKLAAKTGKSKAKQVAFSWLKDQIRDTTATYGGATEGAAPSRGTVTDNVDFGTFTTTPVSIGDLWYNPTTAEHFRVQGLGSVSGWKIKRGVGVNVPGVLTANDVVYLVSRVYGQGKSLYTARTVKEESLTNYVMLTRDHFDITGTHHAMSEAGGTYGGSDRKHQRGKYALEHARNINRAMHLSTAHPSGITTDEDGDPIAYTDGFHGIVPTANKTATSYAGLTLTDLDNLTLPMYRYGHTQEKWGITSREVSGIISRLANAAQRIKPGDNKYGVHITKIQLGHGGVLNLVQDTTLEGSVLKKYLLVLDTFEVEMKTLRDTVLLVDRKSTGSSDKVVDEYLTEWGLKYGHPMFHGLATNISG